jgi:3-methyladenine DNA glycosylase Tag
VTLSACAFWLVSHDTVRLRRCLYGSARGLLSAAVRQAAYASGTAILHVSIIAHGIRALVDAPTHEGLRLFVRRLAMLSALRLAGRDVRWQSRPRCARIGLAQLQKVEAFMADCDAVASEDHVWAVKPKRRATGALRRARTLIETIEFANAAMLGADECHARVRRYVAEHETPHDDRHAFAAVCTVVFASGVGFEAVARQRPALHKAFRDFVPRAVAELTEDAVARLLADAVVRDRAKIVACIEIAKRWIALAGSGTYLANVADLAARDDAEAGWPSLVRALQRDFPRLSESAVRLTLKRWGFFTVRVHPGAHRVLTRLEILAADADLAAVQQTIASLAEKMGRDPFALEAKLALFAGLGTCTKSPRCAACVLSEKCPSSAALAGERLTKELLV